MTNGDNGGIVIRELKDRIARVYDWGTRSTSPFRVDPQRQPPSARVRMWGGPRGVGFGIPSKLGDVGVDRAADFRQATRYLSRRAGSPNRW